MIAIQNTLGNHRPRSQAPVAVPKVFGHFPYHQATDARRNATHIVFGSGCFGESISSDDVFLLRGHDVNRPLADTSDGSMVISEGPHGLWIMATLCSGPESAVIDMHLRHGTSMGLSPSVKTEDGYPLGDSFVVTKAKLGALAIVINPSILGSAVLRHEDCQPHRGDGQREQELVSALSGMPATLWQDRLRLQAAPLQRELSEIRLRQRFGGGTPRRW